VGCRTLFEVFVRRREIFKAYKLYVDQDTFNASLLLISSLIPQEITEVRLSSITESSIVTC